MRAQQTVRQREPLDGAWGKGCELRRCVAAGLPCRGLRTGEQMKTVQLLQSEGVTVEVSLLDCGDAAEAAQLIADCGRLAPVGGIFHLAMALEHPLLLKHVRARAAHLLGLPSSLHTRSLLGLPWRHAWLGGC